MKKFIILVISLTLMLSLIACNSSNDPHPSNENISSEEIEETPQLQPSMPVFYNPEKTTPEDLEEMVIDQSNRHNMNAFCFDNSWIYGAWAGRNYTGEVVKVRYDNSDWTIIDSNTNERFASCQAIKSGYIYYSQPAEDGNELIKVRSSGEDAKVIIANHQGSIQIVGNYIYYTTPEYWTEDNSAVTSESSHLYRCDLNGENVEIILETPVYFFSIFENYVLYQDDRDNMTLHIYDMSSDKDIHINEQRSFMPIYDGNYIYYLSDSTSPEEFQLKLWRMTLDGTTNEEIDLGCYLGGLLLRGDYIYYINKDDSNRIYRCLKDGSDIELVTQDSNISTFQWVNNCLAYVTEDEEGYINGIYLCDADGANKIEFHESDDYWNFT